MKKRLFALLFSILLSVFALSGTALASDSFVEVNSLEAFAAALRDNRAIRLTADLVLEDQLTITRHLVLDGGGHSLTAAQEFTALDGDAALSLKGNGISISNLTIINETPGEALYAVLAQNCTGLVLRDVVLRGNGVGLRLIGQNGAEATVSGLDAVKIEHGVMASGTAGQLAGSACDVTIEGCTEGSPVLDCSLLDTGLFVARCDAAAPFAPTYLLPSCLEDRYTEEARNGQLLRTYCNRLPAEEEDSSAPSEAQQARMQAVAQTMAHLKDTLALLQAARDGDSEAALLLAGQTQTIEYDGHLLTGPVISLDEERLHTLPWQMVDALSGSELLLRITCCDQTVFLPARVISPSGANRIYYTFEEFILLYQK